MDQPRIGQALAVHGFDKAIEAVERVNFDISFVQAEGEFVHIAVEMLRAGVMIDAMHPAFHNRPNALYTVRPGLATDVLARAVIDRLVTKEERWDAVVGRMFVGEQHRANLNVIHDGRLDRLFVGVGDRHGDGATAALTQTEYSGLSNRAATGLELLRFVLILGITYFSALRFRFPLAT